jgi:sugar phosphate isomerase/epimerase
VSMLNRREFVSRATVAASVGTVLGASAVTQAKTVGQSYRICAFEKFLQKLSYDDLADTIAELGFVGIEATVRNKGHVLPERVEEDLPKLVEALQKRNLEVTTMASDVLNPQQPLTEKVLRTAVGLGVKSYRMGFYKYDLKKPILPQLEAIRPGLKDLAVMNRELGISALYQNHSDAKYVGATIWDLYLLLKDIPTEEISCAFDIRHTTIEAGLSWPVLYDVIKPHIGALYVKDFVWKGKKAAHVPLGTGRVDPDFFRIVKQDNFQGPISLHVEYLPKGSTQENIDALRRDLKVLKGWLA